MLKDIGFWNEQGEYIPDIQEVSEVEMDKEFIENLVIANEKLKKQNTKFREALKTYHCREAFGNRCTCAFKRLGNKFCISAEERIAELKAENERLKQEWRLDCLKCEYKNTKADVDKYRQTLQKIKDYLNTLSGIDNDFVNTETYLRILDCITKAEEE